MGRAEDLVQQERRVGISQEDLNAITKLNSAQMLAFTTIRNAISAKQSTVFFVDGPGGTGKTFLYRALLASSRNEGHIILATATSGIAANQLPGGRTAHSRLKIPVKLDSHSYCNFSKQSDMCRLLHHVSEIIWDEAPMANRTAIETVDRTFRDMLDVDLPFGGKIMIFGGDFRQVVPVVVGGTRTQSVQSSIVYSYLWPYVKVLKLVDNIRAQQDQNYSNFVLRVGNGEEPVVNEDMIRIPNSMIIPWEDDSSVDQLIASIFPDLENNLHNAAYMMDRAIITHLNDDVNRVNERVLTTFQGRDEITYYSFDSVAEDHHNLFLPEFLNSITAGNLPPHKLTLKKGCPIMCLRNFDPRIGLCNGTRLMCHNFGRYFIDAEILCGEFKGIRVFLPRIPLNTSEDAKLPFEMTRKQFPVRLSFALTINKSQGQTIPNVGVYLPDHVFTHGQLYVALSRGVSESTTKVLVRKGTVPTHEGVFTRNVVYQELFSKALESESRVCCIYLFIFYSVICSLFRCDMICLLPLTAPSIRFMFGYMLSAHN